MNKAERVGAAHFALVAVFIIGNTVINLPFGSGIKAAIPGFILSVLLSLPLFYMLSFIHKNAQKSTLADTLDTLLGKIFGRGVAIIFAAFSLLCAVACMRNFTSFADAQILSSNNSLLPAIIFAALILALCFIPKKGVVKLALISLVLTVVAEIILFIFSIGQMDFDNIMPIDLSFYDVSFQGVAYLAMSFSQCTVLLAFFMGFAKKEKFYTYKAGVLVGSAVLFVCLLHTLLVFGYSYTGTLRFPYALAMSTVSIGDKFIRLEGFSYLIYFFCCLIKTAVCVISARDVLKNITGRYTKYLPVIFAIVLIVFSALTDFFRPLEFVKIAPWFLVPAFGLPAILLIVRGVKNRTRCRYKTR